MHEVERLLLGEQQLELLDPFTTTRAHHRMRCMVCNHEWSATPISKRAGFKKSGVRGCPECSNKSRKDKGRSDSTGAVTGLRENNKIELLEPFKGVVVPHEMKCLVCNHQWVSTISSKTQTYKETGHSGCPQCYSTRRSIAPPSAQIVKEVTRRVDNPNNGGVMDSSNCEVLLVVENKIQLMEPFKGTKQHHRMKCLVCDHEWNATPLSKRQTFKKYGVGGCPECKNARANVGYHDSRDVIRQMLETKFELLDGYDGRRSINNDPTIKVHVRNKECGHDFWVTPTNLIVRNVECGVCGPTKRAELLTRSSKLRSELWRETATEWQVYKSEVASLTRYAYIEHESKINPKGYPRGIAGVDGAYQLDHRVPVRYCFDNGVPVELCAHFSNLQMVPWKDNVGSRHHPKGAIPAIFHQYLPAMEYLAEYRNQIKELADFDEHVVIGDVVLDLYSPSTKLGILLLPIDKTQANAKTAATCAKLLRGSGIRLISVFADELHARPNIVISKIKHYLGINTNPIIVYARKCTVKSIDRKDKVNLLNTNHLQGNCNSSICYGAYYDNKLVAVMTFSPPRAGMGSGKFKPNEYELVRFCTDTIYRLPGIASRLLKAFQRDYPMWSSIYSYADARWSVGNLYDTLGFVKTKVNAPGYWYVIDGQRKHRWNYRNDMLKIRFSDFDPNLTEYDNMVAHGYHRVWDCGTIRYDLFRPT